MAGNVHKDTKYLTNLKNATSQVLHPYHPRHHGIKMQAHHLISAEGVKRSGMGNKLVEFGYDINELSNLVFIPWTLQGACHLGVQPHRGDHTAPSKPDEFDENDDDDEHPTSYHDRVKSRVGDLEHFLTHECPADRPHGREKVKEKMDEVSTKILKLIQNSRAPLTSIASHFLPDNKCGCGGLSSVDKKVHDKKPDCPAGRDHQKNQGLNASEKITLKKPAVYELKAGN